MAYRLLHILFLLQYTASEYVVPKFNWSFLVFIIVDSATTCLMQEIKMPVSYYLEIMVCHCQ